MKSYAITDIGRVRNENQDRVLAMKDKMGNLPNLFIVADGMGGHLGGKRASERAVELMKDYISQANTTSPVQLFEEAIQYANTGLFKEASKSDTLMGMGTTIVVCTIEEGILYIANVGDSRLYVFDQNELKQITKDHSLVEEMVELGTIKKGDARSHPNKNMITRAVGAAEVIKVDHFEVPLLEETRILMCSDGLSNMLEDREISEIITENSDVEFAANKLVETANLNGGRDNISVVVIKY